MKKRISVLKQTFQEWNKDEPFRLAAIIAYYAIFSLPALLLIVTYIAGTIWGEEEVRNEISKQISETVDKETARNISQMIEKAGQMEGNIWANIIGIATLIFGATGVFFHLQISLNKIWNIQPRPKKDFLQFLTIRGLSLGMIFVIGFLLLISLVLTAALSALSDIIKQYIPDFLMIVFYVLNFLLSLGIITALFGFIFKVLPDVKISWKTVWRGAFITAILFVLGKFGIGLYFGNTNPASVYGAAGSIILVLLWVFYSSLIVFFGAEYTKIYAEQNNHPIEPSKHAVKVKITVDTEEEPNSK